MKVIPAKREDGGFVSVSCDITDATALFLMEDDEADFTFKSQKDRVGHRFDINTRRKECRWEVLQLNAHRVENTKGELDESRFKAAQRSHQTRIDIHR